MSATYYTDLAVEFVHAVHGEIRLPAGLSVVGFTHCPTPGAVRAVVLDEYADAVYSGELVELTVHSPTNGSVVVHREVLAGA